MIHLPASRLFASGPIDFDGGAVQYLPVLQRAESDIGLLKSGKIQEKTAVREIRVAKAEALQLFAVGEEGKVSDPSILDAEVPEFRKLGSSIRMRSTA